MKLVLGSQSPRRKELMEQVFGSKIEIISSQNEEQYSTESPLYDIPKQLALQKAIELKNKVNLDDTILVTADTLVFHNESILGKPKSNEEAKSMLKSLSGEKHIVITGVCILYQNIQRLFDDQTEVHFNQISEADIDYYISHFNPLDKAGSYGIQDYIGLIGIHRIVGCYYNVMGLPIQKVYHEIQKLGYNR